jgi:hypothetical protein
MADGEETRRRPSWAEGERCALVAPGGIHELVKGDAERELIDTGMIHVSR